jgi:hypothetical protein
MRAQLQQHACICVLHVHACMEVLMHALHHPPHLLAPPLLRLLRRWTERPPRRQDGGEVQESHRSRSIDHPAAASQGSVKAAETNVVSSHARGGWWSHGGE